MQAKRPKTARRAIIKNAETFFEKMLDILGNGWYYNTRSAPVAQLDRVSDYESEGREFESLPAHQEPVTQKMSQALFFVVSRKISKVDDRFSRCVL